ncbi:hypothetical protein C0L75_03195 [Clostridium perfringens]
MDAKTLKEKMQPEDVIKVMESLGADYLPFKESGNEIQFLTVCHCGNSHKLYYYKDSKCFHCYSECGQMDIINIVEKVMNFNITYSISYICKILGWGYGSLFTEGFDDPVIIDNDEEILEKYRYKEDVVDLTRKFEVLDKNILNFFHKLYHPSFYEDGISVSTMKKFGIRYDILEQRIIIPHFREDGELIAIRCRNLKQELLDAKKKYMPIVFNRKLLSAKTGTYFYGLNFNKENIRKIKKVILVESEKSVMQGEDILTHNITLALSSSSLSMVQVKLLKDLGVEEVIIALDKEYHKYDTEEEKIYAMRVRKAIVEKLLPYFSVSIMWDKKDYLDYKDSPTDKGAKVFFSLFKERIRVS